MKKRLLSSILAVLMVVSLLPVTASANDPAAEAHTHGEGDNEITFTTPWDGGAGHNTMPDEAGYYYLTSDITLSSTWNVPASGITNLCLNGHVIKADTSSGIFSAITINSGATLNLYDCGTAEHYFTVGSDGLWTLTGAQTEQTRTITGGCITGGTGKYEGYNGSNGGGVCVCGGSLNMYGGNIVGNKAVRGEANGLGGGVNVSENGSFNMSGGAIIGNIAHAGGGMDVYLGTFEMSGGTINENTAAYSGGGVYVTVNCIFRMSNGVIKNNVTQYSGGVINYGSFIMTGGNITGNTASTQYGGGVGNYGSFKMTGGNITGNTASTNSGGVYMSPDSSITLGGTAKITGNVKGGEIVNGVLSGGAVYNLRLRENQKITLATDDDAPESEMTVGITTDIAPTIGNPITFTAAGAEEGDAGFFFSDNNQYYVKHDGTNNVLLLVYDGIAENIDKDIAYDSVQAAIDSADAGDTIRMLNDSAERINTNKEITLDLNGHVLNGGLIGQDGTASESAGSVIKVTGKLTLKDSDTAAPHYFKVTDSGLWVLTEASDNAKEINPAEPLPALNAGDVVLVCGGCITGGHGVYSSCGAGGIEIEGDNDNAGAADGVFTMESGNIVGNIGEKGGGVLVYEGTFNMKGGMIAGNYASEEGGGIYVEKNSGTISPSKFVVTNGNIIYNASSGVAGGAACYSYTDLKAATDKQILISENSAEEAAGGILFYGTYGSNMNLSGKLIIKDNHCDNTYTDAAGNEYNYPVNFEAVLDESGNYLSKVYAATGSLAGSDISVTLALKAGNKHAYGTIVSEYSAKNPGAGVDTYFHYEEKSPYRMELIGGSLKAVPGKALYNSAPEQVSDANHGYVEVAGSAFTGDTVTLTTHAIANYSLSSLTLSKHGDSSTTYAAVAGANNTYTFTMPDNEVDISATFAPCINNALPESESIDNKGYINVAAFADPDAQVEITVVPSDGYRLKADTLKVTYCITSECAITAGASNTYIFTMPAYAVTISAVFEAIPAPPSVEVNEDSYYTVPVTGDKTSVQIQAIISGSNATIKNVTDKEIETVGTGENVIVDLTGVPKSVTAVTIPKTTIDNVALSDADGLEIQFPNGTIAVFDREALTAISEQAKGSDIKLVVDRDSKAENSMTANQKETLKGLNKPVVLDAYFVSGGSRISDFKGGNAELTAVYSTEVPVRVWYITEDGTKELIPCTYDGKTASFVVTHFSHYVIEQLDGSIYSSCPQDETCVYAHFTDADPKAWYHSGVHFCVERQYMVGVTKDAFRPTGNLSRAMIAAVIWRMEGCPAVNYAMTFEDVEADKWYTEAIRWAQSTGVVEGYYEECFGPKDIVTREQLAAILMRYAKYKGIDVSARSDLAGFTDVDMIGDWALENVKWANAVGIINGRTITTMVPKGASNRAEAACMVQRFCEKILQK